MKIFATSDLHGDISGLDPSGFDVVIIAGDFAPLNGFSKWHMHDQKDWIQRKFMPFVERHQNTQFVVVPGNHDMCLDKNETLPHAGIDYKIKWASNVHLLIDQQTTIDGISFYGTPWVPIINYRWAFEAESDKLRQMFKKIPKKLDVLISHSPPHIGNEYLIDRSLQYGMSEPFGSAELANEIFNKKPKYAFCGHIHSGDHTCVNFNETKIYNVSRVNEDYDIAYEPTKIEIKRNEDGRFEQFPIL